MKICFISPDFHPNMGGIEQVVLYLASYLTRKGHTIKVITNTRSLVPNHFPFDVIRNPSFRKKLLIINWADLQVYFNLNKRDVLSFFFTQTPLIVSLHGPLQERFLAAIKKKVIHYRAQASTACSQFVAQSCEGSIIIHSGYDHVLFKKTNEKTRVQDIVFLGRLVPEKGCDLLLRSLAKLRELNIYPTLNIIGDGPERLRLMNKVKHLQLDKQVTFLGLKKGVELVEILNRHQIMVIPSVWEEPFGIVALEGIACGCLVIGSSGGGLKEAIGPCGLTFPNGDVDALAEILKETLAKPDFIQDYQKHAAEHLNKFQQDVIAEEYLKVFEAVLSKN